MKRKNWPCTTPCAISLRTCTKRWPRSSPPSWPGGAASTCTASGPTYAMHARPIDEYPARCRQAAAIMLMIQNNLDPAVAQHPYELITYGGNGTVFQNWAQYLLTMQYLSRDDRRADPGALLRPPARAVPVAPRRAARGRDQRHGHPQLQQPATTTTGMAALGVTSLRPDDRRQLHVHRPPGHRARHDDHPAQRRPHVPRRAAGDDGLAGKLYVTIGPGRHERRPGQGRGDRRLPSA